MSEHLHPNFLVIGAEKAGTTWLYDCLHHHPDIYVPDTKELHYFNKFDSNLIERDHFTRHGAAWYERFFSDWSGQSAIGEVTPMYLCDEAAPDRIAATYPDIKLIVILRNPVDRLYSHYWMAVMKGHHKGDLRDAFVRQDERFIRRGNYADQLERIFNLFPREQVKIFIFEEVIASPEKALGELAEFLGVTAEGFSGYDVHSAKNASAKYRFPLLNDLGVSAARYLRSSGGLHVVGKNLKRLGIYGLVRNLNRSEARYPPLDPSLRIELEEYYSRQVEKIEEIIGRDLGAWSPKQNILRQTA